MSQNFYLFFFIYFFIIFAVTGIGLAASNILKINNNYAEINDNFGYTGLIGIFLLIIYSYLSHFFFKHNFTHNILILSIGFLYFIYSFVKMESKKKFLPFILVFIFLFLGFLILKNHDDFSYYHFHYSYYLTQFSALIGIGQFNHGFRTQSSIFYLNSIFYLPVIKYYMFNISSILLMGFSNLILLSKILKNINSNNINFNTYLSLLSFIFINIFFYRIGEHGSDRSAQILIFLLIIIIFDFIKSNQPINNFFPIFVLMGLIISLKAFYILYLILFFPILLSLNKRKLTFYFIPLVRNTYFILFCLVIFSVLITNFINTGCLMYPLHFTCADSFDWSIQLNEVVKMNNHYEQWSKAGKGPNFSVENPELYIQGLNWVSHWFDEYFFNKVSDYLLGLLLLLVVVFVTFFNKKKIKRNIDKNIYVLYLVLILLFVEWFYNHPALRYGGYCLIALLLFVPFSIILEKISVDNKIVKFKFLILIIVVSIIFSARNINRINKEIEKYSYSPLYDPFYRVTDTDFRFDKMFTNIISNYENCQNLKEKCNLKLTPKLKRYGNTFIFVHNE